MVIGRTFLALAGLLYLGLSVWCVLRPHDVQKQIGLSPTGPAGESEYLTIYGGLDLGLGLMCLIGAIWAPYTEGILLSTAIIHAGIVVFRAWSLFTLADVPRGIYQLGAAELVLMLGAGILFYLKR